MLLAVVSSYVLAELGDKTMLVTVALASDHNWAGVWIGATGAMVLADGLAIAAGALLHRRLPKRLLHGLASVLFVLFGLWLLFDTALGWPWVAVVATASAAVLAAAVAIAARCGRRGAVLWPAVIAANEQAGLRRSLPVACGNKHFFGTSDETPGTACFPLPIGNLLVSLVRGCPASGRFVSLGSPVTCYYLHSILHS